MVSHAANLRNLAALLRSWHKFELGSAPPPALDYLASARVLDAAARELEYQKETIYAKLYRLVRRSRNARH